MFLRLVEANLKVRPSKCQLFQRRVTFLGYVVSAAGVGTDEEKNEVVKNWPVPYSVIEVRALPYGSLFLLPEVHWSLRGDCCNPA